METPLGPGSVVQYNLQVERAVDKSITFYRNGVQSDWTSETRSGGARPRGSSALRYQRGYDARSGVCSRKREAARGGESIQGGTAGTERRDGCFITLVTATTIFL